MTTAAVVAYYRQDNKARVSYAGHPPILYRRADEKAWSYAKPPKGQTDAFPLNIPLAIDLDTHYGQISIPMDSGDQLFVYTDGIIDTPDPQGESFGLTRLKGVLDANTEVSFPELKSAVLDALSEFAENDLTHDDMTLIAMEIG